MTGEPVRGKKRVGGAAIIVKGSQFDVKKVVTIDAIDVMGLGSIIGLKGYHPIDGSGHGVVDHIMPLGVGGSRQSWGGSC